MPAVARDNEDDTVASPDGSGYQCGSPTIQATEVGSSNVFINGFGAVREGDPMKEHPGPGCSPHAPTLSSSSPNVFVNGKGLGRLGDAYGGNHIITSGSSNVFAN